MMKTNGSLQDRVILVTGGAGGLGLGVASSLLALDARVVLCDINADSLDDARAALDRGDRVSTMVVDLSNEMQARGVATQVLEATGRLDGLVSCAGIIQTRPFRELAALDWNRVISTNLTATFHVLQAVANHLQDTAMNGGPSGSIVLFSSVAGRSGRKDSAHYAASKAAVLSLTKSAALAYSPHVRVNAVCPGVFLTHMWDDIMAQREAEFGPGAGQRYRETTAASIPLGRTGEVDELASMVTFLLGDGASYITGQAINVDGGLEMD
jgi:NAD(P)-dependent dehydrogenase (short-subunit alcohol dehydrogenase family)